MSSKNNAPSTTCIFPMSKWRIRGYVQDSDDEGEELETVSTTSASPSQRVQDERVAPPRASPAPQPAAADAFSELNTTIEQRGSPQYASARAVFLAITNPKPIAAALSAASGGASQRLQSESPDPLQVTPASKKNPGQHSSSPHSKQPGNVFDLELLPESDDDLSDPPSEDDHLPASPSPKRRIQVQVVVARPTAIPEERGTQPADRSFRARKPIQLHPYLLEETRYQQECQRRGIKPVRRPKSPPRRVDQGNAETQEQEFTPGRDSPARRLPSRPRSTSPQLGAQSSGLSAYARDRHHSHTARAVRPIRFSSTQLGSHMLNGHKRRKLDRVGSLATADRGGSRAQHRPLTSEHDGSHGVHDVWAIPHSPPHSSSPVLGGSISAFRRLERQTTSTGLPTPSHSSSIPDDAQPNVLSEPDPDISSTRRSGRSGRFQPIPLPGESSSSETDDSASVSEESHDEVRRVRKRIKGVLPASWLRLDRQAQQKRKTDAMASTISTMSPEKPEVHRGVAQRVARRARSPMEALASGDDSNQLIVLSDESDIGDETFPPNRTLELQRSADDASEIAAIFDSRYADDDLTDMENDRLHLFTLSGGGKKRKRQTALTRNATHKVKKARFSDDGPRGPRVAGAPRKSHSSGRQRPKHAHKHNDLSTPPVLSIVDFDQTPARDGQSVPQFIRVAVRHARKSKNQGRHTPRNKHIRLHTMQDTNDANSTLQEWRRGALKQQRSPKSKLEKRQPLADRNGNGNRQSGHITGGHSKELGSESDSPPGQQESNDSGPKRGETIMGAVVSNEALKARRVTASEAGPSPFKQNTTSLRKPPRPLLRTAQLESLETDFGRSHRKLAFERGLRQVDQRFALQLPQWEPTVNPQLARFLTDEDVVRSPTLLAEAPNNDTCPTLSNQVTRATRRIPRKFPARRVDADAREYRQPSEPALQDFFGNTPVSLLDGGNIEVHSLGIEQPTLQGLGPLGTKYPTTFDVSPLALGTYFHATTFVGCEGLHQAFKINERDMDMPAGFYMIQHGSESIECGPWNDDTYARIANLVRKVMLPLENDKTRETTRIVLEDSASVLASFIIYFSRSLTFLDPVDRQDFLAKVRLLLGGLFDQIVQAHLAHASTLDMNPPIQDGHVGIWAMTMILVVEFQLLRISQHSIVEPSMPSLILRQVERISKLIVHHIALKDIPKLGAFLENNRKFQIRENGIREKSTPIESLVICMHVLEHAAIPGTSFWDLLSQELAPRIDSAIALKDFESIWATTFTLVPFMDFDARGILITNRRVSLSSENWTYIKHLLKRLFILYPGTVKARSASLNDYIRAVLSRCYVLMRLWHWKKCDTVLSAIFDFFARRGLKQLDREGTKGSPKFLDCLVEHPSLDLTPGDGAFDIFLKTLALGISGLKNIHDERKLRSIIFRCTPNHGRSYPKDQRLDQDDLDALRNHHDLLCTLHWASTPSCRPKLDLLRGLVQHESSHREACRLNVRAWANLTTFQLSVDEPFTSLQPFISWYTDIMQQTLKQYRLAKVEAEEFMKTAQSDGSSDISIHMVRSTIDENQKQVIATLRDCIAGMQRAIKQNMARPLLKQFLVECDIVQLLELPHLNDHRLSVVIRETLTILKEYAHGQSQVPTGEFSQQVSEESQDYGDFPDLDDMDEVVPLKQSTWGFIQNPLWHLLSNAFGAESAPDDNLLLDCIDTWAIIAKCQVTAGERSWSYFVDSFSPVSWHQLRDTEQTRKFKPYFMASLMTCEPLVYEGHRNAFFNTLLSSLVDREAMLRFQHRLLTTMVQAEPSHPLLRNLPFYRQGSTGDFDINPDTLRTRRLALLSTILANMRDNLHAVVLEDATRVNELKRDYAAILKDLQLAMKDNYQKLRQGTIVTGSYVEFVQSIVHFLKQYTSDICAVNGFFTDSTAFPLPAFDPTYVVGRLCGYGSKLGNAGVVKQLSTFVQTVAQQAALDKQQPYLIDQLTTALCIEGDHFMDKSALRNALLQGIFPAYIQVAFTSAIGLVIAKPILQSLRRVLDTIFYDLRITDPSSIDNICASIWSTYSPLIRSAEGLAGDPALLSQPFVLHAFAILFDAMIATVAVLEYLGSRTTVSTQRPSIITYFERLGTFITEVTRGDLPYDAPVFDSVDPPRSGFSDLLVSCTEDLKDSIAKNWSENEGRLTFGHGQVRKEVLVNVGTLEEEKVSVTKAIRDFQAATSSIFGGEDMGDEVFIGQLYV
jgi:hypothetical protein